MAADHSDENAGSALPPPEIPTLKRPDAAPPKRTLDTSTGTTSAGLPPPEIKPLVAPPPVQPQPARRSGCAIALLAFAVLVVVVALLIWWFVLRPAM
jgi:hypothetical protein